MHSPGTSSVYLAALEADGGDAHTARIGAIRLIKRLESESAIHTVSFEIPIEGLQPALDKYDWQAPLEHRPLALTKVDDEPRIILPASPLGDLWILVRLAKERGLRTIASDYRAGLATHVVEEILKGIEPNVGFTDDQANDLLRPLVFDGEMKSPIYNSYLRHPEKISDITDFFDYVRDEERERFIVDRIDGQLRAFPGGLLHLGVPALTLPLSERLSERGYNCQIIDLVALAEDDESSERDQH